MTHTEIHFYRCLACGKQVFRKKNGDYECSCGGRRVGYKSPTFFTVANWALHNPAKFINLLVREGICLKK